MKKNRGITLIELIVTLAIVAILLTIGAPSLSSFFDKARTNDQLETWYNDFNTARQFAIAYGTTITVCPLNKENKCEGNWAQGYSMFINADGDNELNDTDELLQVREAISSNDYIEAGSITQIHFKRTGLFSASGSLIYCPSSIDSQYSRKLTFSRTQFRYNDDGIISCKKES